MTDQRSRMRIGTWATLIVTALLVAGPARSTASPGDLDPTFGQGGIVIDKQAPLRTAGIAADSRDRIILSGFEGYDADDRASVVRYLPSGLVDRAFGTSGTWLSDPVGVLVFDTEVDSNDSIVLGGSTRTQEALLIRLTDEGQLDATFGAGGSVALAQFGSISDLALAADGSIYAVAHGRDAGAAVFHVLADGTLDGAFGESGERRLPFDSAYGGPLLAIATDGSIFVAGSGPTLAKLTPAGALDESFATGGILSPSSSGYGATGVSGLATRPDGTIIYVPVLCELIGPTAGCSSYPSLLSPSGGELADLGNADTVAMSPTGGFFLREPGSAPFVIRSYDESAAVDRAFGARGTAEAWIFSQSGFVEDLEIDRSGRPVALAQRQNTGRATLVLARFLNTSGPDDADADGTEDGRDRCRLGYSTKPSGCRHFNRSVRLTEEFRSSLLITIRSKNPACEVNHPVAGIFKVVPGPDQRVATSRPDRLHLQAPRTAGRYYAAVRAGTTEVARCSAAISRPIHVTPNSD